MRLLFAVLLTISISMTAHAKDDLKLYRLDCGSVEVSDLNVFSDTDQYVGKKKNLVSSCYLIQSGSNNLLWDAGLSSELTKMPRGKHTVHLP